MTNSLGFLLLSLKSPTRTFLIRSDRLILPYDEFLYVTLLHPPSWHRRSRSVFMCERNRYSKTALPFFLHEPATPIGMCMLLRSQCIRNYVSTECFTIEIVSFPRRARLIFRHTWLTLVRLYCQTECLDHLRCKVFLMSWSTRRGLDKDENTDCA